jgi:hypothetical protein
MHVTSRLRTRWTRAVACAALIAGTLMVSAAPVTAAPAPVRILSVSAENVKPGDKVRVKFRVTNTGQKAETAIVVVGGGLRCTTGCRAEPNLSAGGSRDLEATLVAPEVGAGVVSGLNISVGVRLGGQNSYDFKMVYVQGQGTSPEGTKKPAAGVDRVSGRVRDGAGKAIGGVPVTVGDSAGHEYRTTSDRSGRFAITATARKPIAEGTITVVAAKEGYATARTTARGTAGGTVNVRLTLKASAAPATTSPSPEAAVSTPTVADDPFSAAPPALDTVNDEGSGSLPFMILGALLVAVGLGALTRVLLRRRRVQQDPVATDAGRSGLYGTPLEVRRTPGQQQTR